MSLAHPLRVLYSRSYSLALERLQPGILRSSQAGSQNQPTPSLMLKFILHHPSGLMEDSASAEHASASSSLGANGAERSTPDCRNSVVSVVSCRWVCGPARNTRKLAVSHSSQRYCRERKCLKSVPFWTDSRLESRRMARPLFMVLGSFQSRQSHTLTSPGTGRTFSG